MGRIRRASSIIFSKSVRSVSLEWIRRVIQSPMRRMFWSLFLIVCFVSGIFHVYRTTSARNVIPPDAKHLDQNSLETIITGLNSPVYVTNARDGSNRLFIVEHTGAIKVFQPGWSDASVFLDLSEKVQVGEHQGLLGLTFHPQYSSNGRFFVHYTRLNEDNTNVIAEYQVSPEDPNAADAESEKILLRIPQRYSYHTGGMIEFGPDGYLYIGKGDGASGDNDPENNAQNIEELLGKILRINIDEPSETEPYSSPSDNPFYGETQGRDEIYALGFRNPWRFSFDRLTGELYVGDVGQSFFDEINLVTLGGNYGWRVYEGVNCTGLDPDWCIPEWYIPPVLAQGIEEGRCSIIGGYVYRGESASLPEGAYIYGDFCSGEIFILQNGKLSVLLDTELNITSFGEDESGEIYVVSVDGTINRLTAAF